MSAPGAMSPVEYWNGPVGERWVREQEALDRGFAPFAAAAVERASLQPGERVVDVGCGCGAVVLAAAERVGSSGEVVGIDVSTPMLARARERAAALAGVEFVLADAATHRFERPADAVVSRFGVMFFTDPVAAFANLRGALRPGGRMAFVCWRAPADSAWLRIPLEAATRLLAPEPPSPPDAPGPFSLADPARILRVLGGAGFAEVAVTPFDADVLLTTSDLAGAVHFSTMTGPTGRMFASADDAGKEAVRRAVAEALAPHQKDGRIALGGAAWLVSATNVGP